MDPLENCGKLQGHLKGRGPGAGLGSILVCSKRKGPKDFCGKFRPFHKKVVVPQGKGGGGSTLVCQPFE